MRPIPALFLSPPVPCEASPDVIVSYRRTVLCRHPKRVELPRFTHGLRAGDACLGGSLTLNSYRRLPPLPLPSLRILDGVRKDFINFRLTGRMVASVNNASIRWHYSTTHGWPVSLLEKLELSDLKVNYT